MEKISIAKVRSSYCKQVEKEHRSLSEYLRLINADFEAYEASKPATTERAKESYSFFSARAMKKENLSLFSCSLVGCLALPKETPLAVYFKKLTPFLV